MTKKKQVTITIKKNWNAICQKIIDDYSSQHTVTKGFRTNATITLYIIYNICFSKNIKKASRRDYFGLNYRSLQKWSMMGNNFCQFFKYLLNKHLLQRWQSNKINPKTERPYAVWSHKDGVNSQYRINPEIIKVLVNDKDISIDLSIMIPTTSFDFIPRATKNLAS